MLIMCVCVFGSRRFNALEHNSYVAMLPHFRALHSPKCSEEGGSLAQRSHHHRTTASASGVRGAQRSGNVLKRAVKMLPGAYGSQHSRIA